MLPRPKRFMVALKRCNGVYTPSRVRQEQRAAREQLAAALLPELAG